MKDILPNILIVDDIEANRIALQSILCDLELHIHEATSGEDAIEMVLNNEYCAIVMDIEMPGMDGLEATSKITRHSGEVSIPVIFVTANHNQSCIRQCYEAGGIDHIAKPVDADILIAKVKLFRDLYVKQQTIAQMQEQSVAMLESAGEGIVGVDSDFTILYANSIAACLLLEPKKDLVGQSLIGYLNDFDSEQCWDSSEIVTVFREQQNYHVDDGLIYRRNGSTFPASYTLSPIRLKNRVNGGVLQFQDITERKLAAGQLKQLAEFDTLTGLYNRAMFSNLLNHHLSSAERFKTGLALHFIDLDNFKDVNDTQGHDAGDQVLKEAASRIKACIREYDILARLGGDEFGLIQRLDDNEIGAAVLAERLVDIFQAPFKVGDSEAFIGCSIGISLFPEHATTPSELVKAADTAMYKSKNAGRNQYHFYTEELQEQAVHHMRLVTALKKALDKNEIRIAYQPQIDVQTGRVYGLESLMRWKNPELGEVSPGVFIPIAEQCGLIVQLGQWILERSCEQLSRWHFDKPDLTPKLNVAVNVSVNQMVSGSLAKIVRSTLTNWKLEPHILKLEITESVLMANPQIAVAEIEQINALGVDVAIDDFGTGYSSLSYLGLLPLASLKIDRSFVSEIDKNKTNQKIVQAIMRLAESMDYRVIAEGVETEAELKYLQALGCRYVQGFYFSKPLDADEVEDFVNNFSLSSLAPGHSSYANRLP